MFPTIVPQKMQGPAVVFTCHAFFAEAPPLTDLTLCGTAGRGTDSLGGADYGGRGVRVAQGTRLDTATTFNPKYLDTVYGGFLKWGYPKMDGSVMENTIKMDDLGVLKPPYLIASMDAVFTYGLWQGHG
jgi:hypothetical protein